MSQIYDTECKMSSLASASSSAVASVAIKSEPVFHDDDNDDLKVEDVIPVTSRRSAGGSGGAGSGSGAGKSSNAAANSFSQ